MKKITFLKRKTIFLFFFLLVFTTTFSQDNDGIIDAPGDIMFVAVDNTNDDGLSFVLLDDAIAGTTILITDDEWTGSGFSSSTSEGVLTWVNNTGSTIDAGKVINITNADGDGITVNIGSITETDLGFVLASTNDQVTAFIGASRTSVTTVLGFMGSLSTFGSDGNPITLTGTGLTNGTNALGTASTTYIGRYTGLTEFNSNIANVASTLSNPSNWTFGSYIYPTNVIGDLTGTVFATATTPTVTTTAASSIGNTSATLAGNVTADGNATVTERGIVYSTFDTTPTIAEGATKDTNGSGTGVFSESISGFAAGTQYYYNAYAINSQGTSYGAASSFTTTGKGWTGNTNTDWATASNWSPAAIPLASDNLVIPNVPNKPIIGSSTTAVANNITIDASSSLSVNAGGNLTINGNLTQNGTLTIISDAAANGSLIAKGTATGNVTYNRYLTNTNWHLIGAPVSGQSINSFSGSLLTSGTNNNKSIAVYNNNFVSAFRWGYYTTTNIASAGNFIKAKGYSVKRDGAGTLNFTGTLNVNNAGETIAITDGGDDPNGNRWNLIANPYTAAISGSNAADATNNFLKVNNDASNLDPTKGGLYLWNGSSPYVVKSVDDAAFYIAPGQAFFVHAPDGGGTSASFTEAMQSHQTGNIFLRSSTSYPEIILNLSDGSNNSLTKVRYIQNKTTGLDPGSDVGTFTGTSSSFQIFSHLVSNSEGIDFAIQALPNSSYENMVIPIGIKAEAGKEITFSLNAANFTSNMKMFLEDRETNTFTRLDEANSNYKITLVNALNGIGRFYLHTTESSLSIDKNITLENVSVYKLNNTTLRIAGLNQEKAVVSIFNILGKQVLKTSFTSKGVKDIALPNLSKGVYLVKIQSDSGKLNKKIVLE